MADRPEMYDWADACDYIDKLEAEIERLREALESIDRLATRHVKGAIGMAQRIARIALTATQ